MPRKYTKRQTKTQTKKNNRPPMSNKNLSYIIGPPTAKYVPSNHRENNNSSKPKAGTGKNPFGNGPFNMLGRTRRRRM